MWLLCAFANFSIFFPRSRLFNKFILPILLAFKPVLSINTQSREEINVRFNATRNGGVYIIAEAFCDARDLSKLAVSRATTRSKSGAHTAATKYSGKRTNANTGAGRISGLIRNRLREWRGQIRGRCSHRCICRQVRVGLAPQLVRHAIIKRIGAESVRIVYYTSVSRCLATVVALNLFEI